MLRSIPSYVARHVSGMCPQYIARTAPGDLASRNPQSGYLPRHRSCMLSCYVYVECADASLELVMGTQDLGFGHMEGIYM